MPQLIYRLTYAFALLAAIPLLFHKKIRKGFFGRLGLYRRLMKQKLGPNKPIWFHFASSGEFEQALPIAEALKKSSPDIKILFTYFSPSGKRAVELETERRNKVDKPLAWDYADYLALDLPNTIKRVLTLLNPRAIILINRELWPELIFQCHQAKIPTYLFCSFFPEHQRLNALIHGSTLNLISNIGTVGKTTTDKLLQQFPHVNVTTIGDTRPQRVWERRQLQRAAPSWTHFFKSKNVFLGASLWPEDFKALKPSLNFLKTHSGSRMILVPHEPDDGFIEQIRSWGKGQGISFRRWSQFLQTPDDDSPLIVDSIGLLAELYQISQIAFVGGSFKKRVHNVLEPAAYGNAVLTGPYMKNSFEATEMYESGFGLKVTRDSQDLLAAVRLLLSDPDQLEKQRQLSEKYILDRQGNAYAYLKLLETKE